MIVNFNYMYQIGEADSSFKICLVESLICCTAEFYITAVLIL